MLWCQSWCHKDGTLVQWGIEWRHLNQVTWPPSVALPKDGCPPSCLLGVFTKTQRLSSPTVATHKRTDCLLSPVRATGEEISRGTKGLLEKSNVSVFFLCLFKLKRIANVTSMWTPRNLWWHFCLQMDGWNNPAITHYAGKEPCVNSSWDWQYQDRRARWTWNSVVFHTAIKQSKNLTQRRDDVFYICVRCKWCRGEYVLSPLISDSTSPPSVCACSYRGL